MNGPNGEQGPEGTSGRFIPNNREGRRAAGMKGKRYKKQQQEETKQEVCAYLVFSGVAPGKAEAEAIYAMYRKEKHHDYNERSICKGTGNRSRV